MLLLILLYPASRVLLVPLATFLAPSDVRSLPFVLSSWSFSVCAILYVASAIEFILQAAISILDCHSG